MPHTVDKFPVYIVVQDLAHAHTNWPFVCFYYFNFYLLDAVTIVLFNLLGAFANRPFDPVIGENERDITVGDVGVIIDFCLLFLD